MKISNLVGVPGALFLAVAFLTHGFLKNPLKFLKIFSLIGIVLNELLNQLYFFLKQKDAIER